MREDSGRIFFETAKAGGMRDEIPESLCCRGFSIHRKITRLLI
jgi:hypothetical protein